MMLVAELLLMELLLVGLLLLPLGLLLLLGNSTHVVCQSLLNIRLEENSQTAACSAVAAG